MEKREDAREVRLPGEVVETYRQPGPQEVVLTYRHPLPGRSPVPEKPVRGHRKRGLWIFSGCVAALVLLAVAALVLEENLHSRPAPWDDFERYYDEYEWKQSSTEITIPTWPAGQGVELTVRRDHGETLTAQELYRRANPAVVTVMAGLVDDDRVSIGTGVIFREDGYIITNYHVVEGGRKCQIVLDTGYSYEARYVAGDAINDLAVLKADAEGLPVAEFGDSDLLTVGDKVYAIGNPLGVELRGTLTDGIVSAVDRDVEVDGRSMTLIQTNAALNSGNSGGPLLNEYGQVVGINVIKMSSAYSSIEGLGFAIPSASMRRLVNDLLTYGKTQPEPVLGVTVLQIGEEVANGVWGLLVKDVTPGSAADMAGIREGDYVLTAGGEQTLTSQDLLRVRQRYYVGDDLPMTVWRGGEEMEVILHLEQTVADMEIGTLTKHQNPKD